MEERTKKLLQTIVKEYIKTAQAVGSQGLVEKYKLDISPATVRNEMAVLEEEGYIAQPHTSAGRVPTEKGYQFYVDNFLSVKEPKDNTKASLEQLIKKFSDDHEQLLKNFAKNLADFSQQMIFIGFSRNDSYYTGISNIFSQPEFLAPDMVYDVSLVVDHLDEVMSKIFSFDLNQSRVIIGSQNPFGDRCSAVVTAYRLDKAQGVFGLLGPMRMDYDGNLGLVNYVKELINNL